MAHTPGTWLYDFSGDQAIIVDCEGFTIMDIQSAPHTKDQLEANARLIAAAPYLLQALERIDSNAGESVEWIRNITRGAIALAVQQSETEQ